MGGGEGLGEVGRKVRRGWGGGKGQKVTRLYTIYVISFEGCILYMYIYTYSIHAFKGFMQICCCSVKGALPRVLFTGLFFFFERCLLQHFCSEISSIT